ncbi:MAG: UDP-N-acetylmuramoyl-L-alanyl-D-glutamate--2,6-diaminopimelate ligase [Lachnospiraceae bacterium]|nr:UDP-N-acetylmuramoyl-L-alanyl-D-glutamate--2,6-diaminopimelate ligase [Lachnospiraceae bacterium]
MRLTDLLEKLKYECVQGSTDVEVSAVENDSRKVKPGSLFICIEGANFDGHQYAAEVADKGAKVLVVSKPVEDTVAEKDITVIRVENTRYAMAFISAAWFGHPAEKLKVIGITGTKGKTTTTYLVKSILENAGIRCGLVGTIETIIGDTVIPSCNTTPESYILQETFAKMVDAGMEAVVMEVSSQALMLHRTQGFIFDYGIFTNLEPDHIGPNEHASFEDYMACKGLLFKQCRVGIVNGDDVHMEKVVEGHTCELETYGMGRENMLRAENLELVHVPGKLGVDFHVAGLMNFDVEVPTPGRFSVYNALCAIAICRHFHVDTDTICRALLKAKVKGRIEKVHVSDKFTLMIDYAHNAMALESLLSTLREYKPHRLVCLFGCGGNRSRLRRFEMGEVSGKLADLTVITSDNPRFEEPGDIIEDIKTGIGKTTGAYVEICDRREAIAYVISHAEEGDIIVLAGKGHEDYQEIKGKKYPMDERVIIQELLDGGIKHI